MRAHSAISQIDRLASIYPKGLQVIENKQEKAADWHKQWLIASKTGAGQPPESQPDKFKDAARQIESDEDEARWEARLRAVAKPTGKRRHKESSS